MRFQNIGFICTTPAVLAVTSGLDEDGAPAEVGSYSLKVRANIKQGEALDGKTLELKEMSRFIFDGSIGGIAAGVLTVAGKEWTIKAAKITANPDGTPHHTTLFCTSGR